MDDKSGESWEQASWNLGDWCEVDEEKPVVDSSVTHNVKTVSCRRENGRCARAVPYSTTRTWTGPDPTRQSPRTCLRLARTLISDKVQWNLDIMQHAIIVTVGSLEL